MLLSDPTIPQALDGIEAQYNPLFNSTPFSGLENLNIASPVPRPRTILSSDRSSQSEWEILSQGSNPSRSIIKVVADFDENDPDWYEGAVKISAGSQVRSIKKNFEHNGIYSYCQIGDDNFYIPTRLLQPFVQTNPPDF